MDIGFVAFPFEELVPGHNTGTLKAPAMQQPRGLSMSTRPSYLAPYVVASACLASRIHCAVPADKSPAPTIGRGEGGICAPVTERRFAD
jgi:hypothetical protein